MTRRWFTLAIRRDRRSSLNLAVLLERTLSPSSQFVKRGKLLFFHLGPDVTWHH